MRCPKCGGELDLKLMECDRCGLATPQGKPQTSKDKTSTTNPLPKKSQGKAKSSWLPAFLADSPLNKINVSPVVTLLVVLAFPALVAAYYFINELGVCINCVQIGGNYTTEISIEEQLVRVDLALYQYGSAITGQIRFTPKLDVGNATPPPNVFFIEIVNKVDVADKKIDFQSTRKNNEMKVNFSGVIENEKTLNGNLIVNIPELNCNGKSFNVSIKKS